MDADGVLDGEDESDEYEDEEMDKDEVFELHEQSKGGKQTFLP